MKRLKELIYKIGLPWSSPAPKTKLDRYFNRPAKVKVLANLEMNGELLSDKALQILAGCPAGGKVKVYEKDAQTIVLTSRHADYIENRNHDTNVVEIQRTTAGYVLYLDYIWFSEKCPPGLGAVALLRMAQVAQQLGFSRMGLLAAGGTGIKQGGWNEPYWGFATWPRFGFDTELQPVMKGLLKTQPNLANLQYVSEVIAIDREWWKANGDGWEMSFDLRSGSKSWQTLYNYLSEKGLKS